MDPRKHVRNLGPLGTTEKAERCWWGRTSTPLRMLALSGRTRTWRSLRVSTLLLCFPRQHTGGQNTGGLQNTKKNACQGLCVWGGRGRIQIQRRGILLLSMRTCVRRASWRSYCIHYYSTTIILWRAYYVQPRDSLTPVSFDLKSNFISDTRLAPACVCTSPLAQILSIIINPQRCPCSAFGRQSQRCRSSWLGSGQACAAVWRWLLRRRRA